MTQKTKTVKKPAKKPAKQTAGARQPQRPTNEAGMPQNTNMPAPAGGGMGMGLLSLLGGLGRGGAGGLIDSMYCFGPRLEELAPGRFRDIEHVKGIDLFPPEGKPERAVLHVLSDPHGPPEEIETRSLEIMAQVLTRCGQKPRADVILSYLPPPKPPEAVPPQEVSTDAAIPSVNDNGSGVRPEDHA